MAQEMKSGQAVGSGAGQKATDVKVAASTRERKQYSHVMTDQERFALQTVQRAAAALKLLNEAIKNGKAVNSDVFKLCFQLSQAAGDMLFAKS